MAQFNIVGRRVTLLLFLWLVSCSSAEATSVTPLILAPNDTPIFDDKLDTDWQNWSFGMTLDETNEKIVHTGNRAISVSFDERDGGVQLVRSADIYAEDVVALRFAVHGGQWGGQSLDLALIDGDGNWSDTINIVPVARQWTIYEIPLETLGKPDYLKGLIFQVTSGRRVNFLLDSVVLVGREKSMVELRDGPALRVDLAGRQHLISAEIYGISFADEAFANEIDLPINRWGGNAVTRYNWQLDVTNRASDWYFLNVPNAVTGRLPDDSEANQFVALNQAVGAETILTIPMIGWTPKNRRPNCGFSVHLYGEQQQINDQATCGNGMTQNGEPIKGNDPTDTSRQVDEQYVAAWVEHLVTQHGQATDGGVRYYALDNEPMLWHVTHRDVFPDPLTYDGLIERSIRYAEAVKSADPTAQTLGPVLWGWTAYFYSALDHVEGNWTTPPDYTAHNETPLVEFYLQAMADYQAKNERRLLDVFDLHYYPQGNDIALRAAGGASVQERRLRSTRSLWDWDYKDESWIGESVALIPRMHNWVADNYPGTKIGLSEYNWGGLEHINGALTQADLLGIFGRERLDMAMLWQSPRPHEPGAFAFRIYRNYDGEGGRFGEVSLSAESIDQDQLSIYAAERRSDGAYTIIVINKTRYPLKSTLTLQGVTSANMETYRYSAASPHSIERDIDTPIFMGEATTTFPAQSITLFVLTNP